jgi:hypothetical protein
VRKVEPAGGHVASAAWISLHTVERLRHLCRRAHCRIANLSFVAVLTVAREAISRVLTVTELARLQCTQVFLHAVTVGAGPSSVADTLVGVDLIDTASVYTTVKLTLVYVCLTLSSSPACRADTLERVDQSPTSAVQARVRLTIIDSVVAVHASVARQTVTTVMVERAHTAAVNTRTGRAIVDHTVAVLASPASSTDTVVVVETVYTGRSVQAGRRLTVVNVAAAVSARPAWVTDALVVAKKRNAVPIGAQIRSAMVDH